MGSKGLEVVRGAGETLSSKHKRTKASKICIRDFLVAIMRSVVPRYSIVGVSPVAVVIHMTLWIDLILSIGKCRPGSIFISWDDVMAHS